MRHLFKTFGHTFFISIFILSAVVTNRVAANEDPATLIDTSVKKLFSEFTESRVQLESNKQELFALVDNTASPLFDFGYISKLVLGKNWKKATDVQKTEFAEEFKDLLIVTYATALFQYTGNEKMIFGETEFREKKSTQFAKVNTEVTLSAGGNPIPVVYDMILRDQQDWKIYNLTVGDLNMVLNYRSVIQSSIHREGLDGMITMMKENNRKSYQ